MNKKIDKIKNTQYYRESKKVLQKVYNNIEHKTLEIKYLKNLLSLPKENVIERLELLNILSKHTEPKDKYEELKKNYDRALAQIKELGDISTALKVFHNEFHKNEIKQIEEMKEKFKNGEIKVFDQISTLRDELGEDIKKKVEKINNLKEISLFKNLFDKTKSRNQNDQFESAIENLPNEFKKLKNEIKSMDEKMKKELKKITEFLGLKEDEKTKNELKYIEDSSGAEEDIKSMIYFCQNFKLNDNDNDKNEENIEEKENLEELLQSVYDDIKKKDNKIRKEKLNLLKEKGIYDCTKKGIDIMFFKLFNNQKEGIDFLLTKSHENLEVIKDKILSIDNAVKPNDIDEVDMCIDFFNNVLRNCLNKFELFEKIRNNIKENLFNNFSTFIKILPYLSELDNNSDNSYNLYIKAKKYFSDASYEISLNSEVYSYKDLENNQENEIDLDSIKSIKHKINIPNEVKIKLKENKDLPEGQERISLEKTQLLLQYKEVVSNIELIEQFFSVFQKKGCSLPIEIKISIKHPIVTYFLKGNKITFEKLSKYLLNVKNYLEKTLDSNYKRHENLRFFYGKQFNTLSKHISGTFKIPSFLRYILNNLNDDISIKEGIKSFPRTTQNYVDEFKEYNDDSFKIYNNYLSSVMKENENSIEQLYEKMKIKNDINDKLIFKGIYLYKSDSNSMEEDIAKIFIKKTRNIPIAQNILISSKETSYEEIQAFFHRAFLCRFNTLFAIEINDSLSDFQLKIMNNLISQLLKFQLDKYNNNSSEKIDIKQTNKYIEPLIIFVYNVNKLKESFLNEINKFNPGEYPKIKENISNISFSDGRSTKSSKKTLAEQLEQKLDQILKSNTHIYCSEMCGLGKTEKIKYQIEKKSKKKWIYFPLGGKLSRKIIFEKVNKTLEKVKDIKNSAIHLDLYETEDTSILNEFLFSFCFTKFYANDKNVLYIPINLEIYIEIPNCFYNFLENYPILNYFNKVCIDLKNRDKIRLNSVEPKFFKWMMPLNKDKLTQPKPEEFILSHIGAKKFSYHQINIFIRLFMNQYKLDNAKLKFLDEFKNDITDKCIEEFAECTKYFTLGEYAKLLTKNLDKEIEDLLNNGTIKNKEEKNKNLIGIIKDNYSSNIALDINNDLDEMKNISNQNEIKTNNSNINDDLKKNNEIQDEISKDYEEQRINYIKILSNVYENDLKKEKSKYEIPLIFIIKNTHYYKKIFLSDEKLKEYESKKDNTIINNKFLEEIQYVLQLKTPVESLKEIINKDNYVITTDNFRKMILILYRISANIPVILMGETGCGKTGLIRKLYQLLNNGKDMDPNKNMIHVDSSIDDEQLIKKMDKINEEAKKAKEAKETKGKDFWVLFDEINTCNSLGLLKEIFINRTYNAKNIEENIRLIGTCNPYRLKTEKEENSGLSHPYKTKGLAYDVNILPQSLMYFVFNFGYLEKENEEKYIKSILSNHFKNFDIGLINIVKEIISKCHQYLRQLYDYSIVSLREIKRFLKLYDNLMKYYNNKDELDLEKNTKKSEEKKNKKKKNKESIEEMNVINEKLKVNEIKSLIVATYLNYYTRLIDKAKQTNFESELKENLIKLANYYSKDQNKGSEDQTKNNENQNDTKDNYTNSLDIKWKPLLNDYKNFKSENNTNYSIFFENECDYIIDNINLDKGIAKNRILKENIFLQFIAITSNIPLIIIGKPGSSKSLSFQQLKKSMRGNYSKSNFFRKYPQILTTYFQGSESTLADDIDNLFEIGREKLRKYDNDKNKSKPISLIIFDEIGLSEFAKDNPVKVLHKNLEYDNIKDGLSFVGFSNWKLDSSKLNRVLYLSVPDLDMDIDALNETAKCIAESILENNIDHKLLRLLSRSYQSYQNMIKKIKDYVVYKELELQEMKHVLDTLTQDEIKKNFNNNKKDITLADFIKKRELIETNKIYSWKHGSFINVKIMPEFKDLYLKNKSINQEFHGNRDFYNYIKGVCNIKSLSKILENNDSDISEQIEKVIERNFGGVDINLDIDFALKYNDESIYMEKLKGILNKYPNYKKQLKIPSFFLFKYIFNDELKSLNEENGDSEDRSDEADNLQLDKLRINEDNLTKYNLNECINGNINDNDARYLLLEIEEGLKYLICQNIISQNIGKNIEYMEGSPFINDIKDKNGEYKIKKISEIQNYCNKEMVLILSNLNQIYAFLYDFFNRNFIITDDKKYGRICQGNFTEQLTYIHDNFRIIIMIDKNYVHKQESPFLNRFEKAIVKFEELLDNKQKASSKNIFQELKIKEQMETININYNIKNLLINCNEENIDRLYFYYSNQKSKKGKMQDNEIKEKIFEKIARTLPQDIIIHLDDKHPIKKIYNKKNIFSFKDYMNHLSKLNGDAEQKKDVSSAVTSTKCKFSIIYTFTDIISNIEGINEKDAPQMISEIKRESQLIDLINEKKFKSKQTNNNFYIMHFYQHELDKINFIISTLKIHYGNEDIIFIFIVHIKRIMDKKKKEKIYSIPDVDEKVDQIFIDNLNGLTISLEDLAKNGIRQILDDSKLVDKNNEFLKALKAYFNSYTDKLHFIDNYLPKIIKYFDKNKEFIEIILSKSLDLIYKESNNKDKGKNNENIEYFNEIKKEIFANSYINHNTIDIVSSIINDVIIGKRIRGSIMKVIDALESNNFLTTLLTLDNKTENNSFTSKENLCQMMEMYLDSVKFEEIQGKASFQSNYVY